MTQILKPIAIAALLLAGASPALAATKPAPAGTGAAGAPATAGVNGIAVANIDAVVQNSAAMKSAAAAREVQYKPQIDEFRARQAALEGQMQPMVEKFQRDRAAPGANQADLQKQVQAIQALQESAKQELERILLPVRLSEAYALEQVSEKVNAAIQSAMTKNAVTLLLAPQSVAAASNAYNLNQAILTELDTALPSIQVVPPAGWEPREVREQRAQQAAQANARGTAAAGGEGR